LNKTPLRLLKFKFVASTSIEVRELQDAKTSVEIVVTLCGIVILPNPLQLANALIPREVTLEGITTLVSALQD